MRTFDFNYASVLAITALIFLFLIVFGLGHPGFAADHLHAGQGLSRPAGVLTFVKARAPGLSFNAHQS